MESRARFLGHPVHQMLIVFPLGLLPTSFAFDLVYLITGTAQWATIAYWLLGIGAVGGVVAAVFGTIDWLAIPNDTRAKNVGLWHGLGNFLVISLVGFSWLLRVRAPGEPLLIAIAVSGVGNGIALVTGWLGGELVDRLGVGVSDDAHLDAPSSLRRSSAAPRSSDIESR